ncbi:MAG: IPT/TIG domain-containing protein [Kofleriaceae bacterium]
MTKHDTSVIQRVIARARLRIRGQWALEGAVTATVLAAAMALLTIFLMRLEVVDGSIGTVLLVVAGSLIVGGAILGASRRLDDETVARRIDRASNLSDRLSTAIAFDRTLGSHGAGDAGDGSDDDETFELMNAAIRDGVRAAPRADVSAATPFTMPRDWAAALGFLAISALAAGLALPTTDHSAKLHAATPTYAPPGAEVTISGSNLLDGIVATGDAQTAKSVFLDKKPTTVLGWTNEAIRVRIPSDAVLGATRLHVYVKKQSIGSLELTVIDPKDAEYFKETAVVLDPDERAYVDKILADLKDAARREGVEDLEKFAAKIEALLKEAEEGKITKEQLLEELQKAEEAMNAGQEPNEAEVKKAMQDMAKELKKKEVTKDLGEALENNDLEKAKEELEKLAQKLDPKEMETAKQELEKKLQDKTLSEQEKQELQHKLDELKKQKPLDDKQKQDLQKQMEQASKKMEEQQKAQEQKQQQQKQKLEQEMKRLEKKKQDAKSPEDKLDAERQLQKKKDELQKLDKDQDQKDQSQQRQALKRLQRDMEKAAEQLEKPKDKQESQQEQEERERQASQKMKDAARETGRIDKDQRKQSQQKKMSSQMDDLREAMQRAKQKGKKGQQDPFGKNGKDKDFAQRARGQKGQGQVWKPGQGGKGQQGTGQQPGGKGQQPGGDTYGVGHDPNMSGDPTGKSGATKDQDVSGVHGSKGSSRRETILAAAQKGFATASYKKVYADYQKIVEEVMRNEKLPSSYKYYVKRYFAKIHPSGAPVESAPAPTAPPAPPAATR